MIRRDSLPSRYGLKGLYAVLQGLYMGVMKRDDSQRSYELLQEPLLRFQLTPDRALNTSNEDIL